MANWGTPEYNAQRHREQLARDQKFKQQQESNKRFADSMAARAADQAKQKAAQERLSAFSDGATGNTSSHSRFTNSGSYQSGAAAVGRDPSTGEFWFGKNRQANNTEIPQYTSSQGGSWLGFWLVIGIVGLIGWFAVSNIPLSTQATTTERAIVHSQSAQSNRISLLPFSHYVTASTLNIRKGPGVEFKLLGTIGQENCIRVTGQAAGNWLKVAVRTDQGPREYYANGKFLKLISPTQSCG